MAVKSIQLGWITVSDLEKAKKFFADTLGLQVMSHDPKYGWLELKGKDGGASLGVGQAQKEGQFKPGHNVIFTFTVDDIAKTKKDFETKGVKFIGDIMEVPGHVKLATFVDPDSNIFQLVQKLS